jgi:hypothetical protein
MRRVVFVATLMLLAALITGGCGGSSSPPSVRVSLTAPTDGATVSVSSLETFGTLTPRSATVIVSGKRAHESDGTFRKRITLRRGLNRITLVATAPGYVKAVMRLAIYSYPPHVNRSAGPSQAVARFRDVVNTLCVESEAEGEGNSFPEVEASGARHLRRLRAITPPQAVAGAWEVLLSTVQRQAKTFFQALAAVTSHRAEAKHLFAETRDMQRTLDEKARALGLQCEFTPRIVARNTEVAAELSVE